MIKRVLLLAVVAAGAFTLGGPVRPAAACSCAAFPEGDPVKLAGRHDPNLAYAFTGTVARAEPGAVVIDVDSTLAGDVPGTVRIVQQDLGSAPDGAVLTDTCTFSFTTGSRYLVEASRRSDGDFSTNLCTLTQPIEAVAAAESGSQTGNQSGNHGGAGDGHEAEETGGSSGPGPLLWLLGTLIVASAVVLLLSRGDGAPAGHH